MGTAVTRTFKQADAETDRFSQTTPATGRKSIELHSQKDSRIRARRSLFRPCVFRFDLPTNRDYTDSAFAPVWIAPHERGGLIDQKAPLLTHRTVSGGACRFLEGGAGVKARTGGFLGPDKLDHDGEIFDYIVELHDYLWRVVRCVMPWASGQIKDYLPAAIELLEHETERREHE